MANKTYKVLLEKLGGTSATNYIGNEGELFFDPTSSTLRIGDGTTPGGSVVSGGGGEVTGNISVSETNSEINFVANSSGDGFGYSTIELKPDTNTSSDQYLIIDPTAPSHIHIRAGGQQDDSMADLFLGGERTFVRTSDSAGSVRLQRITTTQIGSFSYDAPASFDDATWFTEGGNHYVEYYTANSTIAYHVFELGNHPDNRVTVYYDGDQSYTLAYGGSASDMGGGVFRVQVDIAPPGGTKTITSMYWEFYQDETNFAEITRDFTVEVNDDVRITGSDIVTIRNYSTTEPITIISNYDGAEKTWSFNTNGTLTYPDNTIQTGASISVAELKALVANCATYGDFQTAIANL